MNKSLSLDEQSWENDDNFHFWVNKPFKSTLHFGKLQFQSGFFNTVTFTMHSFTVKVEGLFC